MKVIFEFDPRERKSKELIEVINKYGERKTPLRRSNHPLDLLSEVINVGLQKFARMIYRLVSVVVKPRKRR